jgi:hypothetical protein
MNIQPNVLIFSTFYEQASQHLNLLTHKSTFQALQSKGIPVVDLRTKLSDGSVEAQILVIGFEHTDIVERYARQFNRDHYLRSHNDRFTEKVSLKKADVEPVGYFKTISQEEALSRGTYSFNTQNDTYHALEVRP